MPHVGATGFIRPTARLDLWGCTPPLVTAYVALDVGTSVPPLLHTQPGAPPMRGLALGQGDAHVHFGWAMDKRTDGRDGPRQMAQMDCRRWALR